MTSKYYKHPQYGHCYGPDILTPIGRVCWPFLTKPKDPPPPKDGMPPGQPRYEVTLLLAKGGKDVKTFLETLKQTTDEMREFFNKGRSAALGECLLLGKNGDGDESDHEKYPFYKGMHVLCGRNAKAVKTVDSSKAIIGPEAISGGMLCRVVISPLITAHGISYKLQAVQLVKDDGVRFGGAVRDSVELFDACSDTEEKSESEDATAEETPKPAVSAKKKSGKEAALDLL